MNAFQSADLLLPRSADHHRWSVIACDQFTSDKAYWQRVKDTVGQSPSTLHLILPEVELGDDVAVRAAKIHETMDQYLKSDIFTCYPNAYIYVERRTPFGNLRRGIVGVVDLEQYDYHNDTTLPIRATEQTVIDRLPPRKTIRSGAPLELSHILLLCDDDKFTLVEPVSQIKNTLPKVYDFELMEGGGHVAGWLLQEEAAAALDDRLSAYIREHEVLGGTIFAVGDGNHSLAAAKDCYEQWKKDHPGADTAAYPGRYAMAELENIHDPVQQFEPIHRVVVNTDAQKLFAALDKIRVKDGCPIRCVTSQFDETIYVNAPSGERAVGILQSFLDQWLAENRGVIDYIHGDQALESLARQENAIGFLLPAMNKSGLFQAGVLPRKTFSMGHAQEKRYYLEGRKIK